MKIIQSKAELKLFLQEITGVKWNDSDQLVESINLNLLQKKIRFPLLEYAANALCQFIPVQDQIKITNKIVALHSIGGNVLAGIILQSRLKAHYAEAQQRAIDYIMTEDVWYACDIIGERVIGHALLTYPEKTISLISSYARHPNKWVVRSIGVATHYAVKNGLKKSNVEEVLQILLSCAGANDFHTKKGIGWAVKTISKFHPEIIKKYRDQIENNPEIKQWFKSKIKIGLSRSFKYATRYTN